MRKVLIVSVFALMLFGTAQVKAQCAMCTTAVESNNKSGANTTKGLNSGILFLLGVPYLLAGAGGIIWYRKFRRKSIPMEVPREKINLN